MLTLGWSDGYSFIPADFAMMSSANVKNRVQEISAGIDIRDPPNVLAKADKEKQEQFVRGKQRIIKTYGKHQGVKLVGYLNYETGEIYCEEHTSYDAVVFLEFL